MKTTGRLITLFVMLSAATGLAHGHDLTLFGGAQFPGKITLASGGNNLTDPANFGVFGVRYGSGGLWGHEETFAYTSHFLDTNSKAVILNGNLRIQAPLPVVKPYVTGGVGTFVTWGTGVSDLGTKFALNYGGGVKIMKGPVGIRFDMRGYAIPSVQSQTLNVGEASVGVTFGF